jgi:predicted acyl esterase
MKTIAKRLLATATLMTVAATAWAGDYSKRYEHIASFDGVQLGALVLEPKGQGNGPFPLVVMPASWSLPNLEYLGRAAQMAGDGYVVVSYTSRGFWDSQGQIDIAGAATVEDVSSVIDWALANTRSNPAAIGASGISYGAGVSLLAAGRDPRIKAVAALSGWADLRASLYANNTPSLQGILLLGGAGGLTGRPGPELSAVISNSLRGNFHGAVDAVMPVADERGAASELANINANGTAVLLANAYNDALFPPSQLTRFYSGLRGPKQMMFSQGDHATAEITGALGLDNQVYTATTRWFDHHLKGAANGVPAEQPVRLATTGGKWRGYASWNAVQANPVTYGLGKPSGLISPTGALSTGNATGWSHSIVTALPTVSDSGVVMISGLFQGLGLPTTASIPLVSRSGAAVWTGPALSSAKVLAGAPSVRVTVTPSQREVSLFAYLYSVNALGIGELLSYKPMTLSGTAGRAQTLDIEMEAAAAEIPAGRKLALVIDTKDIRFADRTSSFGAVSFSSPASAPSQLQVPLR